MAGYLTCKINEGQIKPTCFFISEPDAVLRQQDDAHIPKPCATAIAEADIKGACVFWVGVRLDPTTGPLANRLPYATDDAELVSPTTWAKFERFKFNKEHDNARACPYCDSLELGDPASPEMTCGVCGKQVR